MGGQRAGKDVVAAPPEEEERPEKRGGKEAVVQPSNAVGAENPAAAVNGAAVEARGFVRRVLGL